MKKKPFQVNAAAIPRGTYQRKSGAVYALALASFLAGMSLAGSTFASPEFPNEVREAAAMSCTPSCTLCHTVDPGVSGTATQPFALAMRGAGLKADQPDTVAPAYAELMATLDSDMDGTPDKLELEDQANLASDPNNPDSVPGNGPTICAGEVLYGCGAQIAPSTAPQPLVAWSLIVAAAGGIAWRLRRGANPAKLKN